MNLVKNNAGTTQKVNNNPVRHVELYSRLLMRSIDLYQRRFV